ncbi:MAG: Omp28-related outer membrane protein [Chitinophagales bacterium]
MKKLFPIIVLFSILAGSCTKEYQNPTQPANTTGTDDNGGGIGGGGGNGGGGGSTIGAPPSTFTQKVLIEEFTGEWCGYCPDGAIRLEEAINANPDKVYGASVHNADPFTIPFDAVIEVSPGGFLNNTYGFPGGAVNRLPYNGSAVMDRGVWGSVASSLLATSTAECGLALSSYTAGTDSLYVEVHCGFNTTLAGDYRVTVYLEEDGVPAISQSNYYNDGSIDPNSPLVGIGDPITTWFHDEVVRSVLTAGLGDAIPASKLVPGGEYIVTYGTTITGFNKDNLKITAFVNKAGTDPLTHEIMNVQQSALSVIKDWD